MDGALSLGQQVVDLVGDFIHLPDDWRGRIDRDSLMRTSIGSIVFMLGLHYQAMHYKQQKLFLMDIQLYLLSGNAPSNGNYFCVISNYLYCQAMHNKQ